ncbi:MAG: serine protease [Proteobacteria bacterium]|nr:MAG: serine protease [Pseudomonadota bacterium]
MFLRATLPCLLSLSLLASCAKERPPTPSSGAVSAEAYFTPAPSLTEAKRIARSATVACLQGATCSPSIGLLSFALSDNAAQCTASLVAPDIVATNAHCVPDELQKPGASCADRIWMNFAPSDNAAFESQIACDKILIATGAGGKDVADYAFIKLKKSSRRPTLRISRAGIKDGETIRIEKVDPVKDGTVTGIQRDVSCTAVQHTFMADFNSSLDQVALLTDCEVVHGNSGSALLGSDGTVRGVIFGVLDTTQLGTVFAERGMQPSASLVAMGVGSNYACLPIPASLGAPSMAANCSAAKSTNKSETELNRLTNIELNKFVQENLNGTPAYRWFGWKATSPAPGQAELIPECVYPLLALMEQNRSVGALRFRDHIVIDEYTRFTSMKSAKESETPAMAKVSSRVNGKFPATVDGKAYSLPPCPGT